MKNRWKATLPLFGILLIPIPRAQAQTTTLPTVAAAGAIQAADGAHRITATIGQPVIGNVVAGGTTVAQGFWHSLPRTSATPAPENEPTTGSARISLTASPNPFSGSTQVSLQLPQKEHISLVLYNNLGQPIRTVLNGTQQTEQITLQLSSDDLPSGRYTLTLTTARGKETIPLLLVR